MLTHCSDRSPRHWAVLVAATLAALAGCSSKSNDDPGATSGTKTCADVAKCCDRLSEPQKSACTALAGPKVESACAASYEKICVVADGGSEAGADASPSSPDCDDLNKQCARCANANGRASCESLVDAGDPSSCKSMLDARAYASDSTACQP